MNKDFDDKDVIGLRRKVIIMWFTFLLHVKEAISDLSIVWTSHTFGEYKRSFRAKGILEAQKIINDAC